MASSSFKKKVTKQVISLPGTKLSTYNSQLLISSGLPSFDYLLGGGLPVGSIILIEEDAFDVYSKLFLKFYLAEGILNKNFVHLASLNEDPSTIYNDLPGINEPKSNTEPEDVSDDLKIAWRYKNVAAMNESPCTPTYDVTKNLNTENFSGYISSFESTSFSPAAISFRDSVYWSLLISIQNKIKEHELLPSSKLKSNLLRVAIHSFLSPLWGEDFCSSESTNTWKNMLKFMVLLKAVVRSSFSVVLMTVPSHLFTDPALMSRLITLVDFVIKIESFQGSKMENSPIFKEYHGMLKIVKLPAINTMIPHQVDSLDWGFYLKRKTLSIKKFHLPPDLSETVDRSQHEKASKNISERLAKPQDPLAF